MTWISGGLLLLSYFLAEIGWGFGDFGASQD
jgi:hypothetical protein